MVDIETLIDRLPVDSQKVLVEDRQNTSDIRAEMMQAHKDYAKQYDLISHYFDSGNIVDTSRQIFEFLKYNVPYTKENGRFQTVKSPALILLNNQGNNHFDRVDCKNYSAFIAGIIGSIYRKDRPTDWSWTYRFVSYDPNDTEPGHVFVVVTTGGKELWIDAVFNFFNGGDMHEWELDQVPAIGGLYRISGPPAAPVNNMQTVYVNPAVAWVSFLFFARQNIFSLRGLLTSFPDITNNQLKSYCLANGFDFDQLIRFIQYGS